MNSNTKCERNKGITLIALVVTIVVLLILAGVSISMLTGQNGILNKAAEAKTKSQVANEKEAIGMAVLEALTTGNGTLTAERLNATMKSYLGKETNFTGNGPWQYIGTDGAYAITSKGNVTKGWATINDGNGAPVQVTNGTITLNIGDYINYDPGTTATYTSEVGIDQTKTTSYTTHGINWNNVEQDWTFNFKASDYQKLLEADENKDIKNKGNGYKNQTYSAVDAKNGNIKWKVLGANEETGELLIVAADVLKNDNNSTKKLVLRGITGYLHSADELNNICNVYGQGKGATGGRSINYDDIDKAIGRAKSTVNQSWTYTWTTESKTDKAPYYTYKNNDGSIGEKDYLKFSHVIKDTSTGIFNYYNEKTGKWETNEEDLNSLTASKEFASLTGNYNEYNMNDKNYNPTLRERYKATKGYEALFKTGDKAEIKEDYKNEEGKNVRR